MAKFVHYIYTDNNENPNGILLKYNKKQSGIVEFGKNIYCFLNNGFSIKINPLYVTKKLILKKDSVIFSNNPNLLVAKALQYPVDDPYGKPFSVTIAIKIKDIKEMYTLEELKQMDNK